MPVTFTKQETFDKVANHLLTQMNKAMLGGDCYYRLKLENEILMCAAGCLIPDELYTPNMEHAPVYNNFIAEEYDSESWFGHDKIVCQELQHIHDKYFEYHWIDELQVYASQEGLNQEVLAKYK